MEIEDIFTIATWGQVVFDPVRPRLYFSESCADKHKNRIHNRIMMMETVGETTSPVALTNGPSDLLPIPSPDGQWLAFLTRRSGSAQVWCLPLQGGEAKQITFVQGGVKNFTWSPDGRGLVAVVHIKEGQLEREKALKEPVSDLSDTELKEYYTRDVKHITHQFYKFDGQGFFDKGRDQLVWVPLEGDIELLTSGINNFSSPVFSPDGENLYCLYRAYDPEGAHPGIVHVQKLSWKNRKWTRLPLPNWSIGGLQVSQNGHHLAFYATIPEEHGYGLTTLYRWDLLKGILTDLSSSTNRLVGDESLSDLPANSTTKPRWYDDKVLMLLSEDGRVNVTMFDNDLVTRLWDEKRVVYDFAIRGDDVALIVSDPTHPSGIVLTRLGKSEEAAIWAPTPWSGTEEELNKGPIHPKCTYVQNTM